MTPLRISCVYVILAIVFCIVQIKGDCGGDPNAQPGCKNSFCHQSCNQVADNCAPACVAGGCRCIGNYKYDHNLDKCVPADQCSTSIVYLKK